MRIVIVEDEAPIREGMEKILKKLSPSYVLAGKACDGLEGLEVIRREKPDVVIMDIRMPDMDGLTMLEKLREEGVTSKAVILSAYSEFFLCEACHGAGGEQLSSEACKNPGAS